MALLVPAYRRQPPRPAPEPRITVQFRLLREGEVTTGVKFLRFYRNWAQIAAPVMVFWAEAGSGEFTQHYSLSLSEMLAQGEWLACAVDDALPRKTRAVYMTLNESGAFTYNITTGEGGGDVGSPATMGAVVKVAGDLVNRDVVVIERPLNGQWRLAGYGPTPGGSGMIDVRVTDGSLFAVAVDDWGTVFTPNLALLAGQVVRPTLYGGWLYRIVEAGTLPGTEPEWWAAEGENPSRLLGTARAIAVRYYRPLAHGPIPVEIT